MLSLEWKGGMAFEANPPSGNRFTMDALSDEGKSEGPSPVETLIGALAACSAMDVVNILEKKRQVLHDYRVVVEWDRGPEGVFPRPITQIRVRHVLKGEDLDPAAVERAIQLSDEKYCTVATTLRGGTTISTSWDVL